MIPVHAVTMILLDDDNAVVAGYVDGGDGGDVDGGVDGGGSPELCFSQQQPALYRSPRVCAP